MRIRLTIPDFCQDYYDIYTIIDYEDYKLAEYNWCARKAGNGTIYAGLFDKDGYWKSLHTEILKPKIGFHVHHIDGNTLNNRRNNLQELTSKEHLAIEQQKCSQARKGKSRKQYRIVRLEQKVILPWLEPVGVDSKIIWSYNKFSRNK
jgi:hypothetical protein